MYKSTAKETIEEWRESPNSRIEPRCIKRSKPVNTDRVDSKIRIAVTIVQRGRLYRTWLHVVEIWNVARLSGLRWPSQGGWYSHRRKMSLVDIDFELLHWFLSLDRLILCKKEVAVWRIIDSNYSICGEMRVITTRLNWKWSFRSNFSCKDYFEWNDSFLKQLTLGIRGTGFIFLVFLEVVHGWIASIDVTVIWILITSLQSLSSSKRSKRLSYY